MGPDSLLFKRSLRRHPTLLVAVFVLAVLMGAMGNLGLLLAGQFQHHAMTLTEQWHSSDALGFTATSAQPAEAEQLLAADERVTDYEVSQVVMAKVEVPTEDDTLTGLGVFRDMEASQRLGQHTIVESAAAPVENPVWITSLLATIGGYQVGEEVTVTVEGVSYSFCVQGIFEETYSAMPGSYIGFGLPAEDFSRIWQASDAAATNSGNAQVSGVQALMLEVNGHSLAEAVNAAEDAVDHLAGPRYVGSDFIWSIGLDTALSVMTLGAKVIGGILVVTSLVIVFIAIVIVRSMCRAAVEEELPTLGTLRACGFTGRQAVRSLAWGFTALAVFFTGLGVGLSYAVCPYIAHLLRSQAGTTWVAHFSAASLVGVAGTIGVVIWLATSSAGRTLRKMTTLEALHGGTRAHSFRRPPLPLTSSPGPLTALLGLTSAAQRLRRTLVVFTTIFLTSASAVLNLSFVESLLGDEQTTLQILGGEIQDINVALDPTADLAEAEARIEALDGVESAYPLDNRIFRVDGHSVLFTSLENTDEFRTQPIREGRPASEDDEVVLGVGVADTFGLQVGDTWTVEINGHRASYLVTGITSGGRYMGSFVYLTSDALRRVDPGFEAHWLAVNVTNRTDAEARDAVVENIRNEFGSEVVSTDDFYSQAAVLYSGYLSVLPVYEAFITTLTVVVIILVIWLMIGQIIREERSGLGVRKALGYTSGQQRAQLLWSVMPPVIVGAVLGSVAMTPLVEPSLGAVLRQVGTLGVDAPVHPYLWAGIPGAIILIALAAAWVLTGRINRVSVYELVGE